MRKRILTIFLVMGFLVILTSYPTQILTQDVSPSNQPHGRKKAPQKPESKDEKWNDWVKKAREDMERGKRKSAADMPTGLRRDEEIKKLRKDYEYAVAEEKKISTTPAQNAEEQAERVRLLDNLNKERERTEKGIRKISESKETNVSYGEAIEMMEDHIKEIKEEITNPGPRSEEEKAFLKEYLKSAEAKLEKMKKQSNALSKLAGYTEKKPPETLKEARDAAGKIETVSEYAEVLGRHPEPAGTIKKVAGKAGTALTAAQIAKDIKEGKHYDAAEEAAVAAAGRINPATSITTQGGAGAVRTTKELGEKITDAMSSQDEEELAQNVKGVQEHTEDFANKVIDYGYGVDVKKTKEKAGGIRDWFYDKVYKIAPSWIPENERIKRDLIKRKEIELEGLRQAVEERY